MKIVWDNQPLLKKTPFLLVIAIVIFIGFNVFLYLSIKKASEQVDQLAAAATYPPRHVSVEFAKKVDLGAKQCPSAHAGNPNAPLKFKLFESETCPYCGAENKVLDELLTEYGDLFYAEWYQVVDCAKEAERYSISGVPTFIFNALGTEKPPAYGFLDKEQMRNYICQVSGQC